MIYGMGFLVNPYIFATGSYLTDEVSSIILAYSLRQLDSAISNVVRVRRSSDNAESDFTESDITDGTLTTWTGANDGFVVKLYNQGSLGSTYDITATSASNQPKLVSSGTVLTKNSLPTMSFDSTDNMLNSTVVTEFGSGNNIVISSVLYPDSTGVFQTHLDRPWNSYIDSRSSPNRHVLVDGTFFDLSTARNNTDLRLHTSNVDDTGSPTVATWDNGSAGGSGSVTTYSPIANGVGFKASSGGGVSEYIAYTSTSDRSAIETNVNDFYSIF